MTGIALLGAGIFALEEHLPAIESSELLTLKALYSRSQKSADKLGGQCKGAVDTYFASPETPERSLEDLLKREDIQAVVVCLPITTQAEIIRKAIEAGKHVLSEKPIAQDVATAKELTNWYGQLSNPPIWSVAENIRFMDKFPFGAEKLAEIGGDLITFHLHLFSFIKDDDKYFNTEWRKVPDYQGGFLLDGGVHFVAALRLLLGAAKQDVKQVVASTSLLQKKLAPVDTVNAIIFTNHGQTGSFRMSFGMEFKKGFELEVVTTTGSVIVSPTEVTWTRKSEDGLKLHEEKRQFTNTSGVKAEMEAFGQSIQMGKPDPRQTPIEALQDLVILQALLESGDTGTVVGVMS